jgi:UDPglucose 6-dehydrogenase/UDP-N-acetyl-D-galactosamine dehydrogenase
MVKIKVAPILEKESGMRCGIDFKIGYSPERINPGDEAHALDKITKIVAGMDEETTELLAELYGLITNIYKAKDIRTAEAAKVIENIQRDLNIALMNELSMIFHKMGLDTQSVLEAAATKWNFHPYMPGLVGGHCIPGDPYYLVYKAKELGYHPQVILAGRAINDYMAKHVAEMAIKGLNETFLQAKTFTKNNPFRKSVDEKKEVLLPIYSFFGKAFFSKERFIMGLTYKENVPDTRESPVREMVKELKEFGIEIYGYDPLLSRDEIENFAVKALDELNVVVDCVIVAVAHNEFKEMNLKDLTRMMNDKPVLMDVRGVFDGEEAKGEGILLAEVVRSENRGRNEQSG